MHGCLHMRVVGCDESKFVRVLLSSIECLVETVSGD